MAMAAPMRLAMQEPREAQLAELRAVLGLHGGSGGAYEAEAAAPLAIVYGGISTGKSRCVAQVLRGLPHIAMVDCMAIYSAQVFYRDVLDELRSSIARYAPRDGSDAAPVDAAEEDQDNQEIQISGGQELNAAAGNADDAASTDAADQVFASLNFLSFVKALQRLMTTTQVGPASCAGRRRPRTVFLALDNVDKLLDRGLAKLLPCLLNVNDHLDYMHILDEDGAPWRLCVVLIVRAISQRLEALTQTAHPTLIHFPPYSKVQIADILLHDLDPTRHSPLLRRWLLFLYDLVPQTHKDWLEFRFVAQELLPALASFFKPEPAPSESASTSDASAATPTKPNARSKRWTDLQRETTRRAHELEARRRRHLFGYTDDSSGKGISSGDPVAFIASNQLSAHCLLLLLAAYLASFNPQEADLNLLASSGGVVRKKRARKSNTTASATNTKTTTTPSAARDKASVNQFLVGPKIFTMTRLLAIFTNLRVEMDATSSAEEAAYSRVDTFTHLALLLRLQLLQRASPPSVLDQLQFRCVADARFIEAAARHLRFPLESYLSNGT